MARTLIVSVLRISDRVAEKIMGRGISPEQVREAIEGVGRLPFRWHYHATRGGHRALIVTVIDDEPVLVVLYPALAGGNAEEWWLGSAYRLDS